MAQERGDGTIRSVADAVHFIGSVPSGDDAGWDQIAGFFYRLHGPDLQWSAIQEVADATDDPGTLAGLNAFAFEALIEEARDDLERRLQVACQSPSVRTMLTGSVVSTRYDQVIAKFVDVPFG
jgi:hypothetical protein